MLKSSGKAGSSMRLLRMLVVAAVRAGASVQLRLFLVRLLRFTIELILARFELHRPVERHAACGAHAVMACRLPREERVVQHRPRERAEVGAAGGDDRVDLLWQRDVAD